MLAHIVQQINFNKKSQNFVTLFSTNLTIGPVDSLNSCLFYISRNVFIQSSFFYEPEHEYNAVFVATTFTSFIININYCLQLP